jgi:hypothetical protein
VIETRRIIVIVFEMQSSNEKTDQEQQLRFVSKSYLEVMVQAEDLGWNWEWMPLWKNIAPVLIAQLRLVVVAVVVVVLEMVAIAPHSALLTRLVTPQIW